MKLTEFKNKYHHYFTDEQGRKHGECKVWWDNGQKRVIGKYQGGARQGEVKAWYPNGQLRLTGFYKDDYLCGVVKKWQNNGRQRSICHYKDGEIHGESKEWNLNGVLVDHTFDIDGVETFDFLKNPELYPETPEDKTYFALKYNIGDARFISEDK